MSGNATCRGCGKPIIWGIGENGAKIPLDPRPACYDIQESAGAGLKLGEVLVTRSRRAMVTHFATCPKASDFSREKKP